MQKIRIGITGYGNLGRGTELAIAKCDDMELKGVFTRRDPSSLKLQTPGVSAYSIDDLEKFRQEIDVMIICGGSAFDLPEQGPALAKLFNTVDSFDNHGNIPQYFKAVDEAAKQGDNVSLISVGWDPGMFSINRLYASSILPQGKGYTFWGKGVSQGHSDAIRRVKGVLDGKQYTLPVETALEQVRKGDNPEFTTRQKHTRECFVVAEEGADLKQIEHDIVTMPNYFADYDTTVHFISMEEMKKNHSGIPHGGFVLHSGKTGANDEHNQLIEFSLKLDSNPEFTASVLVAFARAVHRFAKEGKKGALSVFDVPPAYLSPKTGEELRKEML